MFGSAYIDAVDASSVAYPERVAFFNSAGESLTYAELRSRSNALACWIARELATSPASPVIVFGHKAPEMLVALSACPKAGHPYVPIDVVYPAERVASILNQTKASLIIDTTDGALDFTALDLGHEVRVLGRAELAEVCSFEAGTDEVASLCGMRPDDVFYILFTSGSTGEPKGVEVTAECVDGFLAWLDADFTFDEGKPRIWFNRAAYSFDLSVTDLVYAPAHGDTCFALEEGAEAGLGQTFAALGASRLSDWVSTPSFLDQCLADESFGPQLLPNLKRMLFVGETLRPATVREAKRRFPDLSVYNGYGPTESTDFVSLVEITDEMLKADRALPVGYAMPGVDLVVLDPQTLERVSDGEPGELFICGHTVARGYFGRPDLTAAAFGCCPEEIARGRRSYRTGDEMTRGEDGLYYFHGRLDLQIKLHGFRIELGDIEAALCALDEVRGACVVPVTRDGSIHHLCAFVIVADDVDERGLRLTRALKARLAASLPAYMIPTAFRYPEELPLNNNGKVDRKALAALV